MPLNIETFLVTFWTDLFYGFVFVYSLFVHCKVKGMFCFKFAHVAMSFMLLEGPCPAAGVEYANASN